MVVGAFPIAKLSVLLFKQISKPIANVCKEKAKNHPFFRTYVCMPPAQFYNWCEVKAKMWILNLGKPVNIPVLSQEMAIELGANLLGESIIFVIGAGLLIIEYNRQSNKEAAKETKRLDEMKHITSTITDLYFTVQQQQTQLREMERIIHSISGKKTTTPPPEIKDPLLVKEILEKSTGTSEHPPSSTPQQTQSPTTPPPVGQQPSPPQEVHYVIPDDDKVVFTPYPNRGLILQTLNYIQMDVFSSVFNNNYYNKNEDETEINADDQQVNFKRKPAVVSSALYNIENNFRSLF